MAYWTYPSDVTSSDDKINYWREQYESLGEDENAPFLGSTMDNLNAVINYRGWSDEGIENLSKLTQLHGIQSLLNEYTVKWGSSNTDIFWTKAYNTRSNYLRIDTVNCPQNSELYNDYSGYIIRPFYCRIPYIDEMMGYLTDSDIKAKNPYILVRYYGIYSNNNTPVNAQAWSIGDNYRLTSPKFVKADMTISNNLFRRTELTIGRDGYYYLPILGDYEEVALRGIHSRSNSSYFSSISFINPNTSLPMYYYDLNKGIFYNNRYWKPEDTTYRISESGVYAYGFGDVSNLPANIHISTATISQYYTLYDDSLFDTNAPIFDFYNNSNAGSELEEYLKTGKRPLVSDGLDTTFRISIDGLTYPQYKLNWVHTGASEYMDNATIHLRAVNTWTDLTDSLNLGTTIEDKINLFNASSKLIKDIDYGVRGSEYLFSYQGIINDGGIENYINSLTKKGITIGMYISLEVDNITYYSNIVQATLYKDGTSIDTMWDYVFNYIFTNNKLLLGFDEWTESDEDNHDDDPQDGNDDDDPSGDGGDNDPNPTPALHTNGTLTTSYSVTYNHLKSLGAKIWNESFYSSLLKINSNPIENIISCKAIPVSVGGEEKNIVLGNVDMGITGKICDESYSLLVGSITIKGRKSRSYDFLDYEPYTNLSIYLPFIGIKKLDTSICMGRTLKVVYNIDVITGTCRAMIYINGYVMYAFNGNCGVDIPISSMNRAQVEMGFLSSLVGVAGGAGIATVGMAMNNPYAAINGATNSIQSGLNMASSQYNTTTNGTSSPNIDFNINRKCYIIYDRPVLYNDLLTDTFYHTNGRVSHKTRKLLQLRGYTEISPNTDLQIKCTTDELEELRNILSSGFIIRNFN